jgi:hypothetical protein
MRQFFYGIETLLYEIAKFIYGHIFVKYGNLCLTDKLTSIKWAGSFMMTKLILVNEPNLL